MKRNKIWVLMLCCSMSLCAAGCSQDEAKEQEQVTDSSIKEEKTEQDKEVKISDGQVELADALVNEVNEVLDNSEAGIYSLEEIESDNSQEYYIEQMGSTIVGRVVLVKKAEKESYTEYEQHICMDEENYYTIHHEFYTDDEAYQSEVDYLTHMVEISHSTPSFIPIVMDKSAGYVKYLENVEYYGIADAYETALTNARMRVELGSNIEIIGEY